MCCGSSGKGRNGVREAGMLYRISRRRENTERSSWNGPGMEQFEFCHLCYGRSLTVDGRSTGKRETLNTYEMEGVGPRH